MTKPRQSIAKRMLKLFLRAGVLGIIGCVGLVGCVWLYCHFRSNAEVVLPQPSGSNSVGRTVFVWEDSARIETLIPTRDTKRKLLVWVWYPAVAVPTSLRAEYLSPEWRHAREQEWGGGAFLMQNPASIRCHALADALLPQAPSAYPVLIMEPGLGPIAPDYTTLAEDLASHGYVVVGVTPTYSASVVAFPDGQVAMASPQGSIPENEMSVEANRRLLDKLITVWTGDAIFAINQIEKLNTDASSRFFHRLDLSRMGIFGHSFGGATALQVCRIDARCKAAVNLDGYPYGKIIPAHLSQPILSLWSEPEDTHEAQYVQAQKEVEKIYRGLQHGGYQITIQGTRHFNFTDNALGFSPILRQMGMIGSIEARRGLKMACTYTRTFFDQALNNQPAPLLHSVSSQYPEVKILSYP